MQFWRNLSIAFAAGALGGLLAFCAFWAMVAYGVMAYLKVTLPFPEFSSAFRDLLYHHLVLGGLWGFVFALPIMQGSEWWKRALLIGLFPTLVALFYIFPFVQSAGLLGGNYGTWTFLVVAVLNTFWAFIASGWYELMS